MSINKEENLYISLTQAMEIAEEYKFLCQLLHPSTSDIDRIYEILDLSVSSIVLSKLIDKVDNSLVDDSQITDGYLDQQREKSLMLCDEIDAKNEDSVEKPTISSSNLDEYISSSRKDNNQKKEQDIPSIDSRHLKNEDKEISFIEKYELHSLFNEVLADFSNELDSLVFSQSDHNYIHAIVSDPEYETAIDSISSSLSLHRDLVYSISIRFLMRLLEGYKSEGITKYSLEDLLEVLLLSPHHETDHGQVNKSV